MDDNIFYYQSSPVDIEKLLDSLNGLKIQVDYGPSGDITRKAYNLPSIAEERPPTKNRPFSNYKSQFSNVPDSKPQERIPEKKRPFSNYMNQSVPKADPIPEVKNRPFSNLKLSNPPVDVVKKPEGVKNRPFSNYSVKVKTDPISDTKPMPKLEIENETFDVTIGEIHTPNSFYLVRQIQCEEYEDLGCRMAIFYSPFKSSPLSSVNVGGYYVSKRQDNSFVRVQVLAKTSQTLAHCLYIDEGNTSVLSLGGLFPLDDQFKDLPPRSFKASLSDIEKLPFWSTKQLTYFTGLVKDKNLLCFVPESIDNHHSVTLITDENVNEQLFFYLHN